MRSFPAWCLLLAVVFPALGADEQDDRVRKLQNSLLAPCCYSESVAVHRSELAVSMRAEIRRLVTQGRSNREILDGYISQYGMRVLREPEGVRFTWLNAIPFSAALLGLALLGLILRSMSRRAAPPVAASDRAVLIEEELW